MKNVAIITARGGSKRIPRKNIKQFLGKPIINYSIETALSSGLFDLVMVSTDDREIAEVALAAGAEVPFYRSKDNSNDISVTSDVILEVIKELNKIEKYFTNVCCIYPTAPFITTTRLKECYELLVKNNFDSVFPVTNFGFPILRALEIDGGGKLKMLWPENLNVRSQDLKPAYHDSGQFYWINTEAFLREGRILTGNTGTIILNELEVQDIDNLTDWKLAELKYELLQGNK